MKVTDNELLAKIAAATYGEVQDGLFMIVGQRYLIDVALHIGAHEAPDVYRADTCEIPKDEDGVYNASERLGDKSLWERCSANRQVHFFTTQESMLAFFNEYIATHNHMTM